MSLPHQEDARDLIVPFGKHKDKSVIDLEKDRSYVAWLFHQAWFSSRYPHIYNYLIAKGHAPVLIAEHLDHNRLQAKFVNPTEVRKLITQAYPTETIDILNMQFEGLSGADLVIRCVTRTESSSSSFAVLVELKPTVGEEYTEVLRQMRSQRYSHTVYHPSDIPICGACSRRRVSTGRPPTRQIRQILAIQEYIGEEIPLSTVRLIFGDIVIVILGDRV